MRKLWLLFLVGLATSFFGESLLVSSQSPFSTDDMYLEGRPSGDLPVDDEDDQDGGSGSGSGDDDEVINWSKNGFETKSFPQEPIPAQPQSTAESFHSTPTRAPESQDQKTTVKPPPYIIPDGEHEKQVPGEKSHTSPTVTKMPFRDTTKAKIVNPLDEGDDGDKVFAKETEILHKNGRGSLYEQVTTENMWERTEVLAAVIACGVVGFLCAVFLLLLLAYRMKKKDEGSYDLGDTKLSSTAYHKAPTKEFYA